MTGGRISWYGTVDPAIGRGSAGVRVPLHDVCGQPEAGIPFGSPVPYRGRASTPGSRREFGVEDRLLRVEYPLSRY